jgi:hypothetical protein
MLDWLIEVTTSFKCHPKTYFLTVGYFDKYLIAQSRSGVSLNDSHVHKIGIISLYLASKFQDVNTLKSKLIIEKIAFGKHTRKELIQGETEMLKTFDYQVNIVNHYDLLETYMTMLLHKLRVSARQNENSAKLFEFYRTCIHSDLTRMANYLNKMSM